jgi:hypothetical protein
MIQVNLIKVFSPWDFLGGAWGTPDEHYNKLKFANFNDEKLNVEAKGGWVAMVQHYLSVLGFQVILVIRLIPPN